MVVNKRNLHLFLFLGAFFGVFYTCVAQDNLLRRKITINAGDEQLESVLLEISDLAQFTFSYDASILASNQKVSYASHNETVKTTLDKVLPENIDYKVSGNHLILLKKLPVEDVRKKEKYTISGQVYHAATKTPLSDIIIYEVSSLVSAVTDENGRYSFSVPSQFEKLGISFNNRAFEDTIIFITPKDQDISIYLTPAHQFSPTPKLDNMPMHQPAVESLPLVQQIVPSQLFVRTENLDLIRARPAQISLLPTVGTNLKMSGLIRNKFSINVFAGYAYGLSGFEMGGLFNVIRKNVKGVQVAGIGNLVGKTTEGYQMAGIFNHSGEKVAGVQVAGVANMAFDSLQGVQVSGISNVLKGSMDGVQIAGVANTTVADVDGLQISGVINFAAKDVRKMQLAGVANTGQNVDGTQISGVLNYTTGHVKGLQLSGVLNKAKNTEALQIAGIGNIATDNVAGAQIAALFNYAKIIDGLQIGLFNIADSATGTPVGLISFVKRGFHELEFSTNEIVPANVAFKTGVKRFYNIFSGGFGAWNGENRWMVGYGLGTERPLSDRFSINFEYTGNWVNKEQEYSQDMEVLNRLNIAFIYRRNKGLSISAGPSINLLLTERKDPETGAFLTDLAPYSLMESEIGSSLSQLWIGGKIAVHW